MRVGIREQLALLVVVATLVALAIVSLPVWIYVNKFVNDVESSGLSLTASLKAARISAEIELIQTTCSTISTRILLQDALTRFYDGNNTNESWSSAIADLKIALSTGGLSKSSLDGGPGLVQARLYSRNTTGDPNGVLNVTGSFPTIPLPYLRPNGSQATLNDDDAHGYPPQLYPNITYSPTGVPALGNNNTPGFSASPFPGTRLSNSGGLVLGPLMVNSTFALISLTIPMRRINAPEYFIGYMTVVASADTLLRTVTSEEGLGNTGVVLLVGPEQAYNRFSPLTPPADKSSTPPENFTETNNVRFVIPPQESPSDSPSRHPHYEFGGDKFGSAFKMKDYPIVALNFGTHVRTVNNAGAELSTTNEEGQTVAVGFARPQTTLVNWMVVVEQERAEAYEPVVALRNILLGCAFGTAGLILLLIIPCAHWSVKPIRELKAATEKSITPPGFDDGLDDELPSSGTRSSRSRISNQDWFLKLRRKLGFPKKAPRTADASDSERFKIPGKVPERKHYITDELTELTSTFNAMSGELLKQYESLDEKVAIRTRELEISKRAAESANESKTLFIANISHELKTPLNGIMGMCAVCMEEEDLVRIKQSLKTLYKSGDLLLHLLEDLLSFSKNQIGHQVALEEKEFRLGDIRSQTLAIFDKQVREGNITFHVDFVTTDALNDMTGETERTSMDRRLPALGPAGAGRLKDMCLWGDQHRILQVIINLVSNSLKFTPPGGKVDLRIRCVEEVEQISENESRTSSFSKAGSNREKRGRFRLNSSSTHSAGSKGGNGPPIVAPKTGTALSINPMDPKANALIHVRERSPSPPPSNTKTYKFEFEVQDTGPGIPPHMQDKVFEPFVQGDLGLSKKFGGTGLGLSICQQLAHLMGGSVTLTSTVGVGTIFKMEIPLKYVKERASSTASSSIKSRTPSVASTDGDVRRAVNTKIPTDPKTTPMLDKQPRLVGLSQPFFASNPSPPAKEDPMAVIDRAMASKTGSGKLRVLVADDNSTNIEVVSKLLKLEDVYDVTIAKDGQEAYDLVKINMEQNQRFDLIFMDIQMPNLDGLQSTRLIRKMGYSAPIVALTAFSEEDNVKECMESGMNEFLSKPIRRPALKQVLKKFATIPEEPETTSLTRRTTAEEPPKAGLAKNTSQVELTAKVEKMAEQPHSNGVTPHAQVLSPPATKEVP